MAKSSYGIGLAGEHHLPRHLHWGRPLDHQDLSEIATELERSRLGDEEPLEYVAWGGLRYDEPSLKVDYADGTRATEWKLIDSDVRREGASKTLVLELADLAYPLRAELCYRVFEDSDVLERWARLVNVGGAGTIVVRQAHSANWWLPVRDRWRLTYLHGAWGRETQLVERALAPGKTVLERAGPPGADVLTRRRRIVRPDSRYALSVTTVGGQQLFTEASPGHGRAPYQRRYGAQTGRHNLGVVGIGLFRKVSQRFVGRSKKWRSVPEGNRTGHSDQVEITQVGD
jgi:Glycosyl hydrolase family 36 N-terminal domain